MDAMAVRILVAMFLAWATTAHAQPMSDKQLADERATLAAARRQADEHLSSQKAACQKVFATTSCVNEAEGEARRIRRQLREREATLNEIERKQRAEARLAEIARKQSEAQQRARDAAAQARVRVITGRTERERAAAQASAAAASSASRAAAETAERQRKAAEHCPAGQVRAGSRCVDSGRAAEERAAYERKQAEAQAHREAVMQRNAARDPSKAASSLPTPDFTGRPAVPSSSPAASKR